MYELFLTAAVKDADIDKARGIMQGLSWMSARRNVYRVLYFAGQSRPVGLPSIKSMQQQLPRQSLPQWNELSKEFTRSSYIYQVLYEVFPDKDFGTGTTMDLNSSQGTLRWTDFPDPPREKGQLLMHRKKIDIYDQKNLPFILSGNKQVCKSELIFETYSFIRDSMEFVFSRYYTIPPSAGQTSLVASLPAWSDLKPVDPARKWTFTVKRTVPEDNHPEKMNEATQEMLNVRAELDPMFDFKSIDRRVFDTRIAPPPVVPGQV
ncbi:mediator complex, subunit Med18 [Xylariales sp. PMI_506]|nr:mediator complex, subunit Med18 [Xylariales sp. PMI_506]